MKASSSALKSVTVELGSRSYQVHIGAGLLAHVSELAGSGDGRDFVVADEGVWPIWGKALSDGLSGGAPSGVVKVPAGEGAKTVSSAGRVFDELARFRMRRIDRLVSLGGGSTSDLTGFVASTYLRGVPVIHVPTTLSGQVDASIGGKTAINLTAGKNLVGTFHQPSTVIADTQTLASLPEDEFRSGLGEVVKYGFAVEPALLDWLSDHKAAVLSREQAPMEDLVAWCAQLKGQVVSSDEFDNAGRTVLNYGHTFGHALEASRSFKGLKHGEAVGLGMLFAAALSEETGRATGIFDQHADVLRGFDLPVSTEVDMEKLRRALVLDKKSTGEVKWVLLRALGEPELVEGIDDGIVDAAIKRIAP